MHVYIICISVQIKKERDKEIELVIERLEEDASTIREDSERSTEQKIRLANVIKSSVNGKGTKLSIQTQGQ